MRSKEKTAKGCLSSKPSDSSSYITLELLLYAKNRV